MSKAPKQQQTSSELQRTLAGQWSKSEKRIALARSIQEYKQKAHLAVKAVKQAAFLSR